MAFNGFMWMRMCKPHVESKSQSDTENWFSYVLSYNAPNLIAKF